MMKTFIYLIVFFFSISLKAQKLEASISQDKISIGQPIILSYKVQLKKNDTLSFNSQDNAIQARSITESGALSSEGIEFEIVQHFIDTFLFDGANKEWAGTYTVTAWDSGLFIIPGPGIVINDSTYHFQDLTISCNLLDAIDGLDIYDIKENYADVPNKPFSFSDFISNHWWWMLIILFAIIGILSYLKRKKMADEIEEVRPISLKERTLIAISALEKEKLWEKDQLKEHFIELSYIIRSYLTSRYTISLLEKTTYEAKLLLTQKGLNDETVDIIIRILSQSDMVKFAKSKPDVIAIMRKSTLAKQIVAETSPLEFDNA